MSRRGLAAGFGVVLGLACVAAVLWDRGDLLAYAPLVLMVWCVVSGYRARSPKEMSDNLVALRPRSVAHAGKVSEVSEVRGERMPTLAGRV